METITFHGVFVGGAGLSMPTPQRMCFGEIAPACISTTETIALNRDFQSGAIIHQADVYSDDSRYEPNDYQKAAYHQWTMWKCGYLGRANCRVIPSRLLV